MGNNKNLTDLEKAELEKLKLIGEIEKIDLEKTKLAEDLRTYDDRLTIEKTRAKTDSTRFRQETIRLLLVSLITAAITLAVNFITEEYRSDQAKENVEFADCRVVATKMLSARDNLDSIRSSACTIIARCGDFDRPQLKELITECRKICDAPQQGIIREEDQKNTARTDSVKDKIPPQVVSEINRTEALQNKVQQQLLQVTADGNEKAKLTTTADSLNKRMDSLLLKVPEGNQIAEVSQQITKDYTTQAKAVNGILEAARKATDQRTQENGYPKTSWFKEGYFLVFDDFKIVLSDLNNSAKQISVQICASTTAAPCSNIIAEPVIGTASPYQFNRNGFQYIIRLDHIGNAGKNIFKSGAYITVEKYKL